MAQNEEGSPFESYDSASIRFVTAYRDTSLGYTHLHHACSQHVPGIATAYDLAVRATGAVCSSCHRVAGGPVRLQSLRALAEGVAGVDCAMGAAGRRCGGSATRQPVFHVLAVDGSGGASILASERQSGRISPPGGYRAADRPLDSAHSAGSPERRHRAPPGACVRARTQ